MSGHNDKCISDLDFYMAMACISAKRSKDPNTKVGACIVDNKKNIVGLGYNGMPNGVSDAELPWNREGDQLNTKYPYVCHAELNAIINASHADIEGTVIYVVIFPCNECAKLVIQSGIKEVIFLLDKYPAVPDFIAAKRLFDLAKVPYRQYKPELKSISFTFEPNSLFEINVPSNDTNENEMDYISWSEYFMAVACLSATRSKTQNYHVGTCIVNDRNRIVGIGRNGVIHDVPYLEPLSCSAVMTAISTKNSHNLTGCTIYVTTFPCHSCTEDIIHHGIKEIIYLPDGQLSSKVVDMTKKLNFAKVKCRQFETSGKAISIKFTEVQS